MRNILMIMEGNMFSVEENLNISSWTAVVLGCGQRREVLAGRQNSGGRAVWLSAAWRPQSPHLGTSRSLHLTMDPGQESTHTQTQHYWQLGLDNDSGRHSILPSPSQF